MGKLAHENVGRPDSIIFNWPVWMEQENGKPVADTEQRQRLRQPVKQRTVLLSVKNGTFTVYDILMQQFFMRQVFQVHIFIKYTFLFYVYVMCT